MRKLKLNAFHAKILEVTKELGPFLVKKDSAYGDATRKIIRCIAEMFPDGIPLNQITNVYYFIQILNKMSRIATNNDPFGENPWGDIVGYSLLAYAKNELEKEAKRSERPAEDNAEVPARTAGERAGRRDRLHPHHIAAKRAKVLRRSRG